MRAVVALASIVLGLAAGAAAVALIALVVIAALDHQGVPPARALIYAIDGAALAAFAAATRVGYRLAHRWLSVRFFGGHA